MLCCFELVFSRPSSSSKLNLASYGSSDEEEPSSKTKTASTLPAGQLLTKVTHLCSNFSLIYVSDFFDSDLKKSKSAENPPESGPNRPSGSNSNENENEADTEAEQTMDEEELKSMADKLPEGFFDDPKKDAKVRRKMYKQSSATCLGS